MRASAVGMKCPDCARLPRRATRAAPPRIYLAASATAFGLAGGLGAITSLFGIGFLGFFFPLLTAFVIGSLVDRVAKRTGGAAMKALAALMTFTGLILGSLAVGVPLFAFAGGRLINPLIAAGVVALLVGR
ncbi:MAG TPA: hypothetical protein VI541_00605 [Actinomycetota bacterium]|nr:hypothetical protein [Actinomycetota bacterium]